jgi:hypothetical protein
MRHLRFAVRMFVIPLLFAPWALCQNGEIGGRVADPSGAVVPQADITVINTETGVKRTTESNAEGYYTVPLLQPGKYRLTAQKSGFRPVVRDGIVLQIGDRLTLNVSLEVGATAETVTVTGEVPTLRTEDAQLGLVIDNKRMQDLPQYNRDPLAFVFLTPNVTNSSGDLRINGGRSGQTEYFLDGVPLTSGYDHTIPASLPSREAVGEAKVVTNGLSAEFGRLSGGVVVLNTKSGTNEFHGSGYEFLRNDKLNANNWNSNRFGREKGAFHDNVFGATIGGPVRIPKLYNGRDKTFFFFNYEGVRHVTGSNTVTASVPTDLERQGDFSQTLIDQGTHVQLFDPLTGQAEGSSVRRSPFPGNRIPESRFDPLAKIYLGYYPEPNHAPLPNSSHDGNFMGSVTSPSSEDRWTGRLDQNWSSNNITHFTLTRLDNKALGPRWFSLLQPVNTSYSTSHTVSLDHTWTLSPTTLLMFRGGVVRRNLQSGSEVDADASNWGLQQEVVNLLGTTKNRVPGLETGDSITTLGGGSSSATYDTSYTGGVSLQKLWGKHSIKAGFEHRRYYSNVTSGGNFSVAANRRPTALYQNDTMGTGSGFASWLMGIATWGSGTQLAGPASLQTYWGSYLQDDIKVSTRLTVNLGVRWDFEPARTERFDRQVAWDPDYKWDWTPNPGWSWDKVLQQAGAQFPAPAWVTSGVKGRMAMMGTPEYPMRTWQDVYHRHFGPRLGLAYEVLPRTVIRAGYGLNWLTQSGDSWMNNASWNVGYGDTALLAMDGTGDGGLTFPLTFTTPMPGGAGYVRRTTDVTEVNVATMGQFIVLPAKNMYPGYEHVFQFNIQREVGSGKNVWVLEGAYSGNMGRYLPFFTGYHNVPDAYHVLGEPLGMKLYTQVDSPFYGRIPAGTTMGSETNYFGRLLQLHPFWREIWAVNTPAGYSNYHSAYFQAEHRFANGFSVLANYTLSKALQAGGGTGVVRNGINVVQADSDSNGVPQAGLPMSDVYGLSPWDITHRLTFNYLLDLPIGQGRRLLRNPESLPAKALDRVVGGWSLAGTTTYRGGSPFGIVSGGGQGRNWITIGQGKHTRVRFVSPRVPYNNNVDGHTALEGSAGYTPYLNPSGFRVVQDMEIGDVGSTVQGVRGPGFSQWDLALMKKFSLGAESRYLQIRFEAQNLLNHMNCANPGNGLLDRGFGTITGQSGSPRQAMVAAKLYF